MNGRPPGRGRVLGTLSDFVMRFPKAIVFCFLVVAVVSATFVPQLRLYMSFYQLIPGEYIDGDDLTRDYYRGYTELNSEFGGDNWDYYVVQPNDAPDVLDVRAIREMNAVSEELRKLPYVEGTLSLAELVKIANHLATRRYEFPPDNALGDLAIRQALDTLLSLPQYRDQIYGNLLSPDNRTAILLIILEKGQPLEKYREYAKELKDLGFRLDAANPYATATVMYPLNVDTIYLKLDEVTLEEGLWWVALSFLAVVLVSLFLFRSPVFTAITLANLTVVIGATMAALHWAGGYLNILTMLLVAMIFGVGDDYTTYALTVYRNARQRGASLREAIREAHADLGSALLICALVTLSGFASIWLTGFPAIMIFGAMAGAGIFFAYVGCLTLVPALLYLYFGWVDRRVAAGGRSRGFERLVAQGEKATEGGRRIVDLALRGRFFILATFLAMVGLLAYPVLAGPGVNTWNGSYSGIFHQDTYEMRTYNLIARTLGIPVEGVVFVRGDATDPDVLRLIDRLDKATGTSIRDPDRNHNWVRADSLADVVRDNYARLAAEPSLAPLVDRDGDGLPDDAAGLRRMYEFMRTDPAASVPLSRVLDREYGTSLVRVNFNVETRDGMGPDENARRSVNDLRDDVRRAQTSDPAASKVTLEISGLTVTLLAVIASIEFGNAWTTVVMLTVIFGLVTLYYRRPLHTAIVMVPLLAGVLMQYAMMSKLQYEMTYVAVILTSVDMGLGIDLGVHTYSSYRALMRQGKEAGVAIREATGDVNLAMIAALLTDMSAFMLIPWSDISWAAQTARILLLSVAAILLVALFVLPVLLYWDGKRNPAAYRG